VGIEKLAQRIIDPCCVQFSEYGVLLDGSSGPLVRSAGGELYCCSPSGRDGRFPYGAQDACGMDEEPV
jgi:hypothetical protein